MAVEGSDQAASLSVTGCPDCCRTPLFGAARRSDPFAKREARPAKEEPA
jgi:hypothetical protein